MMLLIIDHPYRFEIENICRLFFPLVRLRVAGEAAGDDEIIATSMREDAQGAVLSASWRYKGEEFDGARHVRGSHPDYCAQCERQLAAALYDVLTQATGRRPPWGILTGVRPGKLYRRLSEEAGEAHARRYFADELLVREDKIELCSKVAAEEKPILAACAPDSFSLYVSVPFCPTRCAYCSFVSHSIEGSAAKKLVAPYVELLRRELEATGVLANRLGLKLMTVYIGGGTPTALDAAQLAAVMGTIRDSFNVPADTEYTVEAGRPDTVTPEKLAAMLEGGANRVSVNPQTMRDGVLRAIGRAHTAAQTVDAYELARRAGFRNINMDLIAGLPADDADGFRRSLDTVLALGPESVTVHTLTLKRASRLFQEGAAGLPDDVESMIDYAGAALPAAGYAPYYLYRQSRTPGSAENVGWARPGRQSRYNIYMMDETHTVLAAGASAVTKLRNPFGDEIERIFNFKYPYEYVDSFAQILARKEKVTYIYERYGARE